MSKYLKESLDREGDPLEWWRIRSKTFPLLGRLAEKYLCIPATSVEAERKFSDMGNLLTKKRLCLTSEHVDIQLFLKDKIF